MIEERTLLLTRLVWVHLNSYLQMEKLATRAQIREVYQVVVRDSPELTVGVKALERLRGFSEFVAREYLDAYPERPRLEYAVRCMAASIGIGIPSAREEQIGELIYSDMRAAVIRNRIHEE